MTTPVSVWARDLLMGVRFAVAGGRPGWARTTLTAIGVGLGVALLLLAASAPHVLSAREARSDAREPVWHEELPPGSDTFRYEVLATTYHGEQVRGVLLQPDAGQDTTATPPPGLDAFPEPGEMLVSPALQRMLDASGNAPLRERLAEWEATGTIGDSGLVGPAELAFYAGTDSLSDTFADGTPSNNRSDAFGTTYPSTPLHPMLILLILVICVVLLMPVAVFIATAVRFGGERRDQRLAALRLVGADRRSTHRIAAGEALAGAVLGLVVGVALFLVLRSLASRVSIAGLSAFPGDFVPSPPLTVLILVAVPLSAVLVTLFALRGVAIEPLGVVRDAVPRPRRLGWRLIPAVLGLLLLLPLAGSYSAGGDGAREIQAGAGIVLVLVGATAFLPWMVERCVAAFRGGPVSWQLAVRRLQLGSGPASRAVSGITVAVAGAIALQMLFGGVRGEQTVETGRDTEQAQVQVSTYGMDYENGSRLFGELAGTQGVAEVFGTYSGSAVRPEDRDGIDDRIPMDVVVADCATLRQMAALTACADGDAFISVDPDQEAAADYVPLPGPGDTVDLGVDSGGVTYPGGPALWTVPDATERVEPVSGVTGRWAHGILATPAALDGSMIGYGYTEAVIRLAPEDRAETVEELRTLVFGLPERPYLWQLQSESVSDEFATVQRGLLVGAIAVLALIGASMIVSQLEQLRERKRLLAALVAFGTKRSTLGVSVLWQTAVPVLLGLAVASLAGTVLGVVLMRMVGLQVSDWFGFLPMAAAGLVVIAVVTLASMPLLWRLMRPEGLRTE
ncbi:FtsX-like permease family protein [Streptomyces harbinensis]|uniref:FtsX-like permease family protein n=1 Tax=Streptomyces harbinensis TaxID=1176198 RepID=UPI0034DDFB4A